MTEKPTILLCPHFVCLDVAGASDRMEASASSMYVTQKNAAFDKRAARRRALQASQAVHAQDGIKPILRALRDKLPYFMLPTWTSARRMPSSCRFFGVQAATLTATARIAATTGAQVMPVIATFLPNYQGWRVKFYQCGTIIRGGHGGRHPPHERVHRRARARSAGRVFLDPQTLQDAPEWRAFAVQQTLNRP
jgi:KDO2-lipid IV(A) lauroyltransferase